MFRNIFSNINRLVYMAGAEAPKGIEAQAAAAIDTAEYQHEAKRAVDAIDKDLAQIKDFTPSAKIDLKKGTVAGVTDRNLESAIQTLLTARENFSALAKNPHASRTLLDMEYAGLTAAQGTLATYVKEMAIDYDPQFAKLGKAYEASKVARAIATPKDQKGETMEVAANDWNKMTRMAENYRSETDPARRAQLGLRIMEMAKRQVAGSEGVREYAAGDTYLVVQPSKRGDAYMFAYPMRIEGGKVQGWEHFAVKADGKPASYDQFKMSPDDLLKRYEKARA